MFTRVIDSHPGERIGVNRSAFSDGTVGCRHFGVIEPKLLLPRVHAGMLRRARLLEMLDRDPGPPLTMLDAAVGYGKTTLLRSWCAERPEAVIWMTLDAADDDPVRLWTHLATAVERLGHGLGDRALASLGVRGAPIETAVDELMNGLVAYERPVAIVLDDLHTVGSDAFASLDRARDRTVAANVRVLASTRSDPADPPRAPAGARGADRDPRARAGVHRRGDARAARARRGSSCQARASSCSSSVRRDGPPGCIWRRCGFVTSRIPIVGCGRSPAALGTSRTT